MKILLTNTTGYLCLLLALGLNSIIAQAQDFESSNLPIIFIETNLTIVDEPAVAANVFIIDNGTGEINNINDPYTFVGQLGIELRGSNSLNFPKLNYSIEFKDDDGIDMDTTCLGLPSEEDWVFHSSYADKTHLRNVLAMKISRDMDRYASHTQHFEMFLNDEYLGVYVLMEKVKIDRNRVDIRQMDANDISGNDLSGGYIIELDGNEKPGWESSFDALDGGKLFFQYVYPKADLIEPLQAFYIQAYVDSFEQALFADDFHDSVGKHYSEYVSINSFVDFFLVNEISKNIDAYKLNSYMYKDKDKKLKAGPAWDFDMAWYNSSSCTGGDYEGWIFDEMTCDDLDLMPKWWERFFADTTFTNQLSCKWVEYREGILTDDNVLTFIDSMATILEEPMARNFEKWDILNESTLDHPEVAGSYQGEIDNMKTFVTNRLQWMDENITGSCIVNTDTTGTGIQSAKMVFEIFPNPSTNGQINLKWNAENFTNIQIFSEAGQLVYEDEIVSSNNIHKLNVRDIKAGLYFVKMSNGIKFHTDKLIILP